MLCWIQNRRPVQNCFQKDTHRQTPDDLGRDIPQPPQPHLFRKKRKECANNGAPRKKKPAVQMACNRNSFFRRTGNDAQCAKEKAPLPIPPSSLEGYSHARRAFILTQLTLLRFPSFLGQASVQYPHVFAWKEGSSGSIFSHPIHPPFPFLSILHLVLLYAVINSSFIPVSHTKARKSTIILK